VPPVNHSEDSNRCQETYRHDRISAADCQRW